MDLSIDTKDRLQFLISIKAMISPSIIETYTLPHLLPLIRNGWFWTRRFNGRPAPIPDPWSSSCPHCQWSHTGHFGRRQPDNRQMLLAGDDEGWVNGKKYSNTIKSAESSSNYVSNLFRQFDLMTLFFSHLF